AAPLTPFEAFRSGTQALRAGEKAKAIMALEYAANQGMPAAQWKLGRMYAEGDGVAQSDARAFEYFRRIASAHADDNPGTPQAQAVLGAMLFKGKDVPRAAAQGLAWLTIARESATLDERWIVDLYDAAMRQASEDERVMSLRYLNEWVRGNRRE